MKSKAVAMRGLAVAHPPVWEIPPGLQWFALPDRDLARLFDLPLPRPGSAAAHVAPLRLLEIERERWRGRLDSIEDGTAYMRPRLGFVDGWVTWGPESADELRRNLCTSRFSLDRCEAYHWLWWIDVLINVYRSSGA